MLDGWLRSEHVGAAIPLETEADQRVALALSGPSTDAADVATLRLWLHNGRRMVEAALRQPWARQPGPRGGGCGDATWRRLTMGCAGQPARVRTMWYIPSKMLTMASGRPIRQPRPADPAPGLL